MRHRLLPAALGFVSASAIAAAFVLGADRVTPIAAPVIERTTTSLDATSTTVPVAPMEPSGLGLLTSSLDSVWSLTAAKDRSCLIVLDGSRVLFERNPDLPVTPASTMKLLTGLAAVRELGAATRLRTSVVAGAPITNGVVAGDLVLVGGGDPVLGTVDWAGHFRRQPRLFTPIEALADALVAGGLRAVHGRVVGDESRYDAERYVTSWPERYRNDNETGPLSALSVNDGFAVWDRQDEHDVPWDDPPRDAAAVLTALLVARGVAVGGAPAAGPAPPGAVELAGVDSPTIAELVGAMLLDSDNGTAELLVKEIGFRRAGAGSSAAGTEVMVRSLAASGLPMAGTVVRDGSGLDRGNSVTCRLLASLLGGAPEPIDRGLPVAAQTGTLYRRFLATPVAGHLRAKTGSIGGVASLAGFADGPSGELTFAQVLNGIGSYAEAMRLQEALGAALVGVAPA